MVFKKNKRQNIVVSGFALLIFASSIFFLTPSLVYAFDNPIVTGFKFLLLGIFTMIGGLASIAVTIFGWAVNPDYISGSGGLLNRASVYAMWQFVRDFFNLFFILVLLYTAFTIVFQVAKDYKKTLLSIVLAALFVNFSFPITRVIIDVTNVPMYYFVNQIAAQTGGEQNNWLGTVLSASQIKDILIPGAGNGGSVSLSDTTVSQLLMAIVFLFIFSITLLILAVLFVVRVAGLLILLIFSSVGFAASVIPGLEEYGSKWWKKLWEYSIFGPAAMLMLFVATSFFKEISADNTRAQFLQAGIANSVPEQAGFISAMAMFSIPIIMLWMAIALAGTSAIAGAKTVTGKGTQAGKWLAKKVSYNNPVGRGFKKAATEGKFLGVNYGKTRLGQFATGNYWKEPGKVGAAVTGFVTGRTAGAKTEISKLHAQQVNKAVKENKENKINNSVLVQDLSSGDQVEREAAALSLAENKALDNAEDLKKALVAVGDNLDYTATILKEASNKATSGLSVKDFKGLTGTAAFAKRDAKNQPIKDATGNYVVDEDSKNFKAFKSKLKDSGQLKTIVEYEFEKLRANLAPGQSIANAKNFAFESVIKDLSADDMAKQSSLHKDSDFHVYVAADLSATNPAAAQNRAYYQEAYKKMSKESRQEWINRGNTP